MAEITTPGYGTPNVEMIGRWLGLATEDDGPFWAVNLMKYRDVADYGDDREARISGREADDLYSPLDSLADIGAELVFVGVVSAQARDDDVGWDRIGIVNYPSRAAFFAMQQTDKFQKSHVHKEAGMERPIVMSCLPRSTDGTPGTDGVTAMRVLEAADDDRSGLGDYLTRAASLAETHGATASVDFDVEGEIVGDGGRWAHVGLSRFPDQASIDALVADPEWRRAAGGAAVARSHSMVVEAPIDRLARSVAS